VQLLSTLRPVGSRREPEANHPRNGSGIERQVQIGQPTIRTGRKPLVVWMKWAVYQMTCMLQRVVLGTRSIKLPTACGCSRACDSNLCQLWVGVWEFSAVERSIGWGCCFSLPCDLLPEYKRMAIRQPNGRGAGLTAQVGGYRHKPA
jgi:hypothetical protein